MAKYYVESGTLQLIVQADDAHKAALWAIHRTMQQILPVYDEHCLSPETKADIAFTAGAMVLGEMMFLSEVGFGGSDAVRFNTTDMVIEWNQLMIALTKLESVVVH
ncbi:MAG: hypothetical protein CL681_07340 [Blastopirellula sp.]|nr:hypothetical protein [Blastopirellula sp.]|tara:strand:+ start:274 stop:591 length:318 start_codon:yes stop_codon:yes gene_type:complete